MRTDPFRDALAFLLGQTDDHAKLGGLQGPFVALFGALLVGSLVVAWLNWQQNYEQRTRGHVGIWGCRVLMGAMWFQGAVWKLPLPVSGGLRYWTEQMAENAAFPFVGPLVRGLVLPNMPLFDPFVLAVELGLATSFILGLFVRPVASLGMLYVAGLWIGLYRHPFEWPWTYVFIAIVHVQFVVQGAGRSLGIDALLQPARERW